MYKRGRKRAHPGRLTRSQRGYARTGGKYRYNGSNFQVEHKWLDTNILSVLEDTWTRMTPSINLLKTGTGASQLVGRQMLCKSIQLRGMISTDKQALALDTAAINEHVYIKIAIVLDKQCNGAVTNPVDVWEANSGSDADVNAFRNLANTNRFRVLKETTIKCQATPFHYLSDADAQMVGQMGGCYKIPDTYISCNIPIEYAVVSDSNIADVRSNNIVVFGVLSCDPEDDDAYSLHGEARIRYEDA